MIYRFHSTSTAIYWGIHPRAKPYQPFSTTQDHSQGTTYRRPQTFLPALCSPNSCRIELTNWSNVAMRCSKGETLIEPQIDVMVKVG